MTLSKSTICKWYPPFHDPDSAKVFDTTGAGNMFLGAFTIAFQKLGGLSEAAVYGSVAASFAVEQSGLPKKDAPANCETWNGAMFTSRLQEYRKRIAQ